MEPNHADRPQGQQNESSTEANMKPQSVPLYPSVVQSFICAAACAALGGVLLIGFGPRAAQAGGGESPWMRIAWAIGLQQPDGCGNCRSPDARAGQVTTMVTRFNQFLPGGAKPIPLIDGQVYYPQDLECLVTAGYCALADLSNQVDPTKGWIWSDTTRRFTREP